MLTIFIINIFMISLCIIVHYEVLLHISKSLPTINILSRFKVLLGFLGVLFAHIIEVWIYASGFYFCVEIGGLGKLNGNIQHNIVDYSYYSFVTYTSLGLGDILPTEELRFLTGIESLIGLLLIAWSASFMYYQMKRYWKEK